MAFNKEHVLEALRTIRDSQSHRDLVELDAVRKCSACEGFVSMQIAFGGDDAGRAMLRSAIESAVRRRAGEMNQEIKSITIEFVGPSAAPANTGDIPLKQAAPPRQAPQPPAATARALPGVTHVIAVGAGKGGVGKSSVAVNLAVGLARAGHAVGLLDGDIYGPSLPTMLGLGSMEVQLRDNLIQPFYVHGVKAMTIGKLVDPEKPLIWRGPMAHGAFKQLIEQTQWGELDYLIIDLPPGTGDVSLTMAQTLSLTGAVIVCTPQKVAQDDAVRAARMFQQLNIEVLGVVENMSWFIGDDGKEYDIFGKGGAEKMAQRLGLPFLGAIPINTALRFNSDSGNPTANFADAPGASQPAGSRLKESLEHVVRQVETQAALAAMRSGAGGPMLSVS